MNTADSQRFRQLITGVYSFYRKEVSEFQLSVWWEAMKALDYDAVKDAFNRHLLNPDNGQFEPKPADVVKLVGGGAADRALIAWTKFDMAVQYVGSYDTVVFDDPIIHQVVEDMGGWIGLCAKDAKEWPFVKNEFVARYRGYSTSRMLSFPAKLIGRIEQENAVRWPDKVPAPKFIGDKARAQLVLHNGGQENRLARIGELLPQQPSQLLADQSTRHST